MQFYHVVVVKLIYRIAMEICKRYDATWSDAARDCSATLMGSHHVLQE